MRPRGKKGHTGDYSGEFSIRHPNLELAHGRGLVQRDNRISTHLGVRITFAPEPHPGAGQKRRANHPESPFFLMLHDVVF